jgi:RNA polymerase sigma-70 factor (ECF subfamily)
MARTRERALDRTRELERIYRERGDRMWRSLLAFSGDPDVASDAVAEAFAQALRRGGAIREPERWVWRAAFRIAAGELKERGRFDPPREDRGGHDPGYAALEETARELVAALRQLSPKQRAAVVLHHAAGYPLRDVAAILGSTQGAVKVHLSRGRSRLRDLLAEEDEEP